MWKTIATFPSQISCHTICTEKSTVGFYNVLKWDKVFKTGPSKICGRQPLKNFTWSILEDFSS